MKNKSVAPKTQMPTNGILAPDYPTCPFLNVITSWAIDNFNHVIEHRAKYNKKNR